jgi:hypothetical protein
MVVALGQTRNGDRADASRSYKKNRETAAMGSIVLWIKARPIL